MTDLSKYTIGWICAIDTEYTAARAFLDEDHGSPEAIPVHDHNAYTLGRIGKHNVVIAVLPDGEYGLSTAGVVAQRMLDSFPNLRVGLMVGIGGGAPSQRPGRDIRLGDVVISSPRDGHPGVLQYDFGKTIQDQEFKMTRSLNLPPDVLRAAVTKLRVMFEEEGNGFPEAIDAALSKKPRLRRKYGRPPTETDRLFLSHVVHDPVKLIEPFGSDTLVPRQQREVHDDNPAVFYGLIASSNQLMKDANIRDRFAAEKDVLCFEMEAAGLMNHFPCLVIRGICDYSDSHKNKQWQGYAAMAAAAYAKALIHQIQTNALESEKRAMDIISNGIEGISREVARVNAHIDHSYLDRLSVAKEAQYENYFNEREPRCHHRTRVDLLNEIHLWSESPGHHRIFWLSGVAGTGKSTIARTVARRFVEDQKIMATFFFKRGVASCNTGSAFFSTIARQLARNVPELPAFLVNAIKTIDDISSRGITDQFNNLVLHPLEKIFAKVYERRFKEVYEREYVGVYNQALAKSISLPFPSSKLPEEAHRLEDHIDTVVQHVSRPLVETVMKLSRRLEPAGLIETTEVEATLLTKMKELVDGALELLSKKAVEMDRIRDMEPSHQAASKMAVNITTRRAAKEAEATAQAEADRNTSLFLVIDALDECSMGGDVEILIPLLAQLSQSKVCNAKIFVTSRPEIAIRYTMEQYQGVYENILHKVAPQTVSHDIQVFLEDSLEEVKRRWNEKRRNSPSERLSSDWPGIQRVHRLVSIADGLFVFAATACRFLATPLHSPEQQLSLILDAARESGINDKLSPTYLPVLCQLTANLTKREAVAMVKKFHRIIGAVILLEQPLPVDSIAGLLKVTAIEVDHMLDHLISVFDVPQNRTSSIRPFHLSFRDFLLGPEAGDFRVNYEDVHRQLAIDCLEILTRRHPLRYNICGLKIDEPLPDESSLISNRIPLVVQYACLHWVYHFDQGGLRITPNDRFHQFLEAYLLNWLEVLIILGCTSKAASMVDILLRLTEVGNSCDTKAYDLLEDAWRFIRTNAKEVTHPLQIYWSGLVFAPRGSAVKETFSKCVPAFATFHTYQRAYWQPILRHVLPQGGPPALAREVPIDYAVATISPDTNLIATGFTLGVVRLWLSTNGEMIRSIELKKEPLLGTSNSQLESNSEHQMNDRTSHPEESHIKALKFTDDSSCLISATATSLRVHLVDSGEELWTMSNFGADLDHMDVSSDQDIIASTHSDHTVRVWSLSSGKALRILTSISGSLQTSVSCTYAEGRDLRFSRGYVRMRARGFVTFCSVYPWVIASFAQDIHVWDVSTGQRLRTFEQDCPVVCPIVPLFGTSLISFKQDDGKIQILDVQNGEPKAPFWGRSGPLGQLAASHDADLIAYNNLNAFGNEAITVRSIENDSYIYRIPSPSWELSSILLSPDGKFLVHARELDVNIWALPPTKQMTEPCSNSAMQAIAVVDCSIHKSVEASSIASTHKNGDMRLWSQETGEVVQTITGSWSGFAQKRRILSPDKKHIYEALADGRHALWRIHDSQAFLLPEQTSDASHIGACVHDLWFATFSPDSQLLVTSSGNEVCIWTVFGEMIFQDNTHCGGPVTFSADGKLLEYSAYSSGPVSGDREAQRRVAWTEAGAIIAFPELVSDTMTLTTSPDVEWIAYSRFDTNNRQYIVSICSVDGGIQVVLNENMEFWSSSISMSQDGSCTAYMDSIGRVVLYSLETNQRYLFSVACGDDGLQLSYQSDIKRESQAPLQEVRLCESESEKTTLGHSYGTYQSSLQITSKGHGYEFDETGQWITWYGARLLQVPTEMQPRIINTSTSERNIAIGESAIAWVTGSKEIVILGVSPTIFPWSGSMISQQATT